MRIKGLFRPHYVTWSEQSKIEEHAPAYLKNVIQIITETGLREGSHTGTPQGGILSPLIFNVAMSALDEHLHAPWKPGGAMATRSKRAWRQAKP